jgi:hypothetical protein
MIPLVKRLDMQANALPVPLMAISAVTQRLLELLVLLVREFATIDKTSGNIQEHLQALPGLVMAIALELEIQVPMPPLDLIALISSISLILALTLILQELKTTPVQVPTTVVTLQLLEAQLP